MPKYIVRAELALNDNAVLNIHGTLADRDKFSKVLKKAITALLDEHYPDADLLLCSDHTASQIFLDPVDHSPYDTYYKDSDVPFFIQHFAVGIKNISSEDGTHVLVEALNDPQFTKYKGLAWKEFDPETDMPVENLRDILYS